MQRDLGRYRNKLSVDGVSRYGIALRQETNRLGRGTCIVTDEHMLATGTLPLGNRFPAAHQYLRMRLLDEIFPIAAAVSSVIEVVGEERWLVRLGWPELEFRAQAEFSGDDLRRVFGPWSTWARIQAFDIADRLPV